MIVLQAPLYLRTSRRYTNVLLLLLLFFLNPIIIIIIIIKWKRNAGTEKVG